MISVTTRRAQSGEVRLEVRDNGIGIAPDLLTRIFEAFEQGDPRITQQFGGLGLGLAISRALVELHKGRIFAQSDGRGNGATFTIVLPAHSPEQTPPSGMPPAAQPPGGGPLRVLIVEDHLDTARTLARLLARLGFFVKTATTVAGAVQLAGEEHFDIVVSDLGLPDATGYDLIRTLQKSHPIRGIAMSGYGMEEDIRRSLEAGFSEHLVKPLNVPQLEQAIRRIAPDRAAV